MPPPAILCRGLHKTYTQRGKAPVHALRGLELEVLEGECFGLLGPNGAGKTTTAEIVEGLIPPTSGEVEVFGLRWGRDTQEIRHRLGISLQETRFDDKLTAEELIRLFRSFYREGREPTEVLEEVGLTDKRRAYYEHLSGGQKQRLAVACALVGNPSLLMLDEPTTGLDPQARRALWEIIRAQQQRGCTILLTTHYMDEAERLCDRVAVVDQGQVIALGTPQSLITSLASEHVIEFALGRSEEADSRAVAAPTWLGDLPTVSRVAAAGPGFVLQVGEPHVALPALLRRLEAEGLRLAQLTTRHASLEDVFVNLTGRHLTDEAA
jgi:ABC-2 type transport system ATP-binding protein